MATPGAGPDEDSDAYDGHANYREQFAPKPPRAVLRSLVRVLLAIGLAVTITWILHKLLYPGRNIVVIFTAGFAGLVGLIGGAFGYSWLNDDADGEQKDWGPLDAIAVAIIVFGFAMPLSVERAQEARERQARTDERESAIRAKEEAQSPQQESESAFASSGVRVEASTTAAPKSPRDMVVDETALASETEPPVSKPATSGDVIRCRDASGAIQFTQGYCPSGTTRVDSPPHD